MRKVFEIGIIVFAIVGVIFTGVFVAMQFGLLNVRGSISERNNSLKSGILSNKKTHLTNDSRPVLLCEIHTLSSYAPETAQHIYIVLQEKDDIDLVKNMITIASRRFSNNAKYIKSIKDCQDATTYDISEPLSQTAFAWADSAEWAVMKSAFIRDQDYIRDAAKAAGISPRLLLGGVIGEQFRFFTNSRDSFKRYFEPLKILASLSKFSFGIAGLKPETAKRIEENLHNPKSPFYLGSGMENVITYPADTTDLDSIRFERITDTKNTYFSYLYVGLFMRQVTAQWASTVDISNNPGVLATLYNLGFNRSIPKPNPAPGGAPITVNGEDYTFGDLADEFYYSGELLEEFPY
jgi:hypothetical protein